VKISNILFDLDGTLTDPKVGITGCIRFSLDRLGTTPPLAEELTWCIGPPLRESFSRLLKTSDGAILDQALFHYRKRFSETGMYENEIYPEIVPSLRRISGKGFRVFLATSKPEYLRLRFLTILTSHNSLKQFMEVNWMVAYLTKVNW
jgi:phosphoglycolate phosphatase